MKNAVDGGTGGRDERQDEGGRECDAPIWVTREKTYVVAYEGYALRRVQLGLGKRAGEGKTRGEIS